MIFRREKTMHTPLIVFDKGKLYISGRSIPENPSLLYDPLIHSVLEYSLRPEPNTEVNIMLEYSNSSTNRALMELFNILYEELFLRKKSVIVNWYYITEDTEMYNLGNDFKDLAKVPFALIGVDSFPEISL